MKFKISIVMMLVICLLSGCSWVTSGNNLLNVSDYEKKMLTNVFGEEVVTHIEDGNITKEELKALEAYRAGGEYLLQKYPSYNIKMESFLMFSENSYEITFSYNEESFTCQINVMKDNYTCSDNLTTD